jgi:transposase
MPGASGSIHDQQGCAELLSSKGSRMQLMSGMLGIDVSKGSLSCALLDRETERFCWQREYANTAAGVSALLAKTPTEVPWVLEPTGRYSLTVAKQARAAGRQVLMAPPRKAKRYLASIQDRAKTDRIDAPGLAWFAVTRPKNQPLPPYPIHSEAVERVQQLLSARRGVVDALMSLRQQQRELPYAKEALEPAIAALAAPEAALDQAITTAAQVLEAPALERLQAVVGIGPVTATAIVARMQGRKFPRAAQFVAFVGLDVGIVQSGKRKGEWGLTKQGDAELRKLLYMGASSAIRSDKGPFKARYQQELARGRKATAALCIIARKLARVCWAIVEKGETYDPKKVYAAEAASSGDGGRTVTFSARVPGAAKESPR